MKNLFILISFILLSLVLSKELSKLRNTKNVMESNSNSKGDEEEDLDLQLPDGYVVGFSEKKLEGNFLENHSETEACVKCRFTICKIRIVLVDKCIKIFGKKICIKVPTIQKYDCIFQINPCLPLAICKLLGGTPV